MAKKPSSASIAPDVEIDLDLQDDAAQDGVSNEEPVALAPMVPVAEFPTPSDEVLLRYNQNEATWLAVNNPAAFARWQELMNPTPRSRRLRSVVLPTLEPQKAP